MTSSHTSPWAAAHDPARLAAEYPAGPAFEATYRGMTVPQLHEVQQRRFARVLETAWQTPFYRDRWRDHGLRPGDVTGLADLPRIPVIDKSDILDDVSRHPPFGTLATRLDRPDWPRLVQTTSGTTGDPQPVCWGPWGREAQNAVLGRTYRWVGLGAADVAYSVYGHGLVNGGHFVREAVTRYTEAVLLTAGTGAETRTTRQVAILARFRATALLGFADYLRRLAEAAREAGLEPGVDIPVRLVIGHLPHGAREQVEADWPGARAFDWYGVADTGVVAAEGPDRDGQYLWEDANVVEILDPDTRQPVPDGAEGELVLTSLTRTDLAPLIRFATHDLTRQVAPAGGLGLPFRRVAGLLGRSDQMVKLRGVNVYPTAVAGLLAGVTELNGEYYCRLERRADGADRLVVVVEATPAGDPSGHRRVGDDLAARLTDAFGVRMDVEVVPAGATAEATGLTVRQKPTRLVDVRPR